MAEAALAGLWGRITRPSVRQPTSDAAAQFDVLVLPHLDAAYNLARILARDDDAAREIVQESCVRALRYIASYRGGNPRAWLLAIVRSRFLEWARRQKLDVTEPLPATDSIDEIAAGAPSAEALLLIAADAALVRKVLESLPVVYKEVLIMREMEDLPYRDIALAIESPIGTVMSRLARARQAFAVAWARETESL